MASRIAAHSGDIVKGIKGTRQKDDAISNARRELDWENIFKYAIDPELAQERKGDTENKDEDDFCSMCGNLCAIKINQGKTSKNS